MSQYGTNECKFFELNRASIEFPTGDDVIAGDEFGDPVTEPPRRRKGKTLEGRPVCVDRHADVSTPGYRRRVNNASTDLVGVSLFKSAWAAGPEVGIGPLIGAK